MRNPWPFPPNLVCFFAIGPPRRQAFSPRERQLVRLASLGCTPAEIAAILGQTVADVHDVLENLGKRLGATERASVRRWARRRLPRPGDRRLSIVEQLFLRRHSG